MWASNENGSKMKALVLLLAALAVANSAPLSNDGHCSGEYDKSYTRFDLWMRIQASLVTGSNKCTVDISNSAENMTVCDNEDYGEDKCNGGERNITLEDSTAYFEVVGINGSISLMGETPVHISELDVIYGDSADYVYVFAAANTPSTLDGNALSKTLKDHEIVAISLGCTGGNRDVSEEQNSPSTPSPTQEPTLDISIVINPKCIISVDVYAELSACDGKSAIGTQLHNNNSSDNRKNSKNRKPSENLCTLRSNLQ